MKSINFDVNMYSYSNPCLRKKIVVLADLHQREYDIILQEVYKIDPDYIVIPGDMVNGAELEKGYSEDKAVRYCFGLIAECQKIAPTYVSLGNHEKWLSKEGIMSIHENFNHLLDDMWTRIDDEIVIGGLTSLKEYKDKSCHKSVDTAFLNDFVNQVGFKILLCHHPEYYEKYLINYDIQLVVSGHAHGGQVRIFDKGLFAPGQGLLPKYTSGIYEDRLFVSRGLGGTESMPRIFNRPEIAVLYI